MNGLAAKTQLALNRALTCIAAGSIKTRMWRYLLNHPASIIGEISHVIKQSSKALSYILITYSCQVFGQDCELSGVS